MKFEKALTLLRDGKRIRRKVWFGGSVDANQLDRICGGDLLAEDWEEYEPPEPVKVELEWIPVGSRTEPSYCDAAYYAWSDGAVTSDCTPRFLVLGRATPKVTHYAFYPRHPLATQGESKRAA